MKRPFLRLILVVFSVGVFLFTSEMQLAKTTSTTIVVPDDYPTIHEAIAAAYDNDVIFVKEGTYTENIVVDKAISIIGENPETTAVNGTGATIRITSNAVTIMNFTLQTSWWPVIQMNNANYCDVTKNIIMNSDCAIRLDYSSYNTISLNNIIGNDDTIFLVRSSHNTITLNNLHSNGYGIDLVASNNNTISKNRIIDQRVDGITVASSSHNNTISNNHLENAQFGIYLLDGSSNTVFRNNVTGITDKALSLNSGSRYDIVFGNTVADCHVGVHVFGASNDIVHHNNIINNAVQVYNQVPGTVSWDNGYPSGGNYWSDYSGVDTHSGPFQNETGSDGVGDSPYVIDESARDRYPLMHPHVPFPYDLNDNGFVDISDVLAVCMAFGSSPGHPRWNPRADVTQDGQVRIDDVLLVASNYPVQIQLMSTRISAQSISPAISTTVSQQDVQVVDLELNAVHGDYGIM